MSGAGFGSSKIVLGRDCVHEYHNDALKCLNIFCCARFYIFLHDVLITGLNASKSCECEYISPEIETILSNACTHRHSPGTCG